MSCTQERGNLAYMKRPVEGAEAQPAAEQGDLHVLECVSAPPPSVTRRRRQRVLVVDDSRLERADIVSSLSSVGDLEIFEASNGAEAIAAVDRCKPDLVVCDQEMPTLGGLQTLQILRRRWSRFELPFLMLTARQDTEDKITAFRFGANDYVTKPAQPEELVARVHAHLNLKTAVEGAREARAHLMESGRLQLVGRVANALAHQVSGSVRQVSSHLETVLDGLESQQQLVDALRDWVLSGAPADEQARESLRARLSEHDRVSARAGIQRARDAVVKGIQSISECCDGVQDFAATGADERVSIDINRAIENTLRVANPAWSPHAALSWDLEPDLPSVECIDGQIKQVLLGLVLNASEAVQGLFGEGPCNGRVVVGTRSMGSGVEIRISDNGPGVPVALREQIFEPFFSTKEAGTTSGLGLSFVYDVVVRGHGGRINCEKSSLGGACFRIWLPFGQEHALTAVRA